MKEKDKNILIEAQGKAQEILVSLLVLGGMNKTLAYGTLKLGEKLLDQVCQLDFNAITQDLDKATIKVFPKKGGE